MAENSKGNLKKLSIVIAIALLFSLPTTASAQTPAGNLYGNVVDGSGEPLPGASLTLSGQGAPQVQMSNEQGLFRFLGLSPGTYQLIIHLDGYSDVEHAKVSIGANRNTTLIVEMSLAIEEVLTVTTESPLLDERRIKTGTTLEQTELERVPSARDPWAVLQTVPGVLLDRINVGGNESGKQAQFVGPGSGIEDAVWAIDGVVITDMSAVGNSPTFYNFDAFEEMDIATGGADATLATGGVTLNMVTKRGTNTWRGSARYLRSDDDWQDGLDFDSANLGKDFDGPGPATDQAAFSRGDRLVAVQDWGLEIGGPIVRDKVWLWANYGKQEIDLLTLSDFSDSSEVEAFGGKLNAQPKRENSLVGFYNFGDRTQRGQGASPGRAPDSTWNMKAPTDIYKIEDTQIFSPSFYLTGMVSLVENEAVLTPQGGLDGPSAVLDESFIWQSNFVHHASDRPQEQVRIDGDYFFASGEMSHELKFGVGYRTTRTESLSTWPGNALRLDYNTAFGALYNLVQISRPTPGDFETEYTGIYVQDTLTKGRLTANLGLRYDAQDGRINQMTAPAVEGFETFSDGSPLFPEATTPARDVGFDWQDLSPRLGVTWALGEERRTLLRAGFSQFAKQLGQENVRLLSPLSYSYAYFYYEDGDGDGRVTRDEVFGDPLFLNNFDPLGQTVGDRVDPDYQAATTTELLLGVEHALRPDLVVGLGLTRREIDDIREDRRLVQDLLADGSLGETRANVRGDYAQVGSQTVLRPDGSTFDVPIWRLASNVLETGDFLVLNGERRQVYTGVTLTVNKRLANRWMLRGNVNLSNFEWDIPDGSPPDPNLFLGGSQDGGPVLQGSSNGGGSKGGVYLNSEWSYSITGMYQVAPQRRWGFNVAASVNGRQGYAIPYYARIPRLFVNEFATLLQAVDTADEFRNDDVHVVDLRLEKDFRIREVSFTVAAEAFNFFNEGTVLQREHRLGISRSNHVEEVLSPRVLRFGVRLRLR